MHLTVLVETIRIRSSILGWGKLTLFNHQGELRASTQC